MYTKDVVAFARVGDESETKASSSHLPVYSSCIDFHDICYELTSCDSCQIQVDEIPLAEILSVQDASMVGQHLLQGSLEAAENQQLLLDAIIIHTIPGGFNSGRTYYLKANSGLECSKILEELTAFSHAARKRAESQSKFANLQRRVRRVFNSRIFQGFTISCIILVSM